MAAQICPECGGTQVNCPVCGLPPKRKASEMIPVEERADIFAGLLSQPRAITQQTWEVQGVDVSKWNGTMDFSVTKTKCQYAFLRAGYGTQWKDSAIDAFYINAMANDFPIGLYWYCTIGENLDLMAESFASEIASHPPQLDIVLDCEQTTLGMTATLDWIKALDSKVYNLTGKKPEIYTSPGFWNSKVARSSHWVGRNLWNAAWTNYPVPLLPYDWSAWVHWQWSADNNGKGLEYGSTGGDPDIDLNRFYGTVSQFNTRYGTHIKPIGENPPPPPPPTVPEKVIVNTSVLNLRHAPNAYVNNICGTTTYGKILYPEAIERDSLGREWYKLGKKIYTAKWLTKLP